MRDKERADALVEREILVHHGDEYELGRLSGHPVPQLVSFPTATRAVTDWRVAGACLERWPTDLQESPFARSEIWRLREPRAIIDAYLEATQEGKRDE